MYDCIFVFLFYISPFDKNNKKMVFYYLVNGLYK